MANEAKPLRTILFAPGNNEAEIRRRATETGADAICIDLEDGLHDDERADGRALARRIMQELGPQGHTFFCRVNGISTGKTGDDLEVITCPELHGIYLAKVQGPEDVFAAGVLLDHFERRNGVEVGHTFINPLMESLTAIDAAYEVGSASPRVEYMGGAVARGGDQAHAVGYHWTAEGRETRYIRASVLMKARRAGIKFPISGIGPPDPEGLRAFAQETKELGYSGMMCGGDQAIKIINEIMSPTAEEIARHLEVKEMMEKALSMGKSNTIAAGYDRFLDMAHLKTAYQQLDLARKLGMLKE